MRGPGSTDKKYMSVRALFGLLLPPALLLASWSAAADPGRLPVTTLRYEVAQGAEQDEEDGVVEPEFLRHSLSMRLKETISPAMDVAVLVRYSRKDFIATGTDYASWLFSPELVLRKRGDWRLAASLPVRLLDYQPLSSGFTGRDLASLGARLEAALDLTPWSSLSSYLRGTVELADDPAESRQLYTLGVGVESRLGAAASWLLAARYSGTGRFPLGPGSAQRPDFYHLGAFSVTWDPNRR